MNRRSFLKFAGLAPIVPVLATGVLSSTPVVFDPKCLTGITSFAFGGYAGTMKISEAVNNMGSAMMVGEAMESGKKGDIIKVRFAHYEVKV